MRAASKARGAATLVVVMVLFLVMALLAAYANRALMFEQRVASSYFRASLSQEMAEAGIEWSLSMLNSTAIDGTCTPVNQGGQRFADRYLGFDAANRVIKPITPVSRIMVDCTRSSAEGWTCRCPAPNARVVPTAIGGEGLVPSFGLRITSEKGGRPAELVFSAQGCTDSVVDRCNNTRSNSKNLQGLTVYKAVVSLVSAVRTPPAAPIIVKKNLVITGGGLGLHNTDPRSAGLLYVTGGSTPVGLVDSRLDSVPGTAAALARVSDDETLKNADTDAFKMFMGATASRYAQHPALRKLACNGDCGAALAAAYTSGMRMIWVDGPLSLSSNQTLGSAADPLLLIATGDVTLSGPFQLTGMLVVRGNLSWSNTSALPSLITGMVLVEGDAATDGQMDVVYQQALADQLRNRMGSYVRVSGGWIDQ